MRYPAIFASGLGVGYLIGARAGRERYDEMARSLRRIRENPALLSAAGLAQAQAAGVLSAVRRTVGSTDNDPAWTFGGRGRPREIRLPMSPAEGRPPGPVTQARAVPLAR